MKEEKKDTRKKKEASGTYRRWRKDRISKEQYLKEKRNMKELIEEKKRIRRETEEIELRSLRNEAEMRKIINKKRHRKEWITNNISKFGRNISWNC